MLIVVGSRRNGNSLALANYVKKELENERIHVDIIVPGNQRIHLCTGCMDCDKTGVCDFTDDMKSNIDKICDEDIVMFITPARWNLLSGDIKIFMDRLNPLFSRKGLVGKKAIAVAIGAKAKDFYSSYEAMESLRSFFEASGMDCVLTWNFCECKDAKDIMNDMTELQKFVAEVKRVANKN